MEQSFKLLSKLTLSLKVPLSNLDYALISSSYVYFFSGCQGEILNFLQSIFSHKYH